MSPDAAAAASGAAPCGASPATVLALAAPQLGGLAGDVAQRLPHIEAALQRNRDPPPLEVAAQIRVHASLVFDVIAVVAEVADRVIFLADGEVIADGTTRQVLTSSPAFAPQVTKAMPEAHWLTVAEVERFINANS